MSYGYKPGVSSWFEHAAPTLSSKMTTSPTFGRPAGAAAAFAPGATAADAGAAVNAGAAGAASPRAAAAALPGA